MKLLHAFGLLAVTTSSLFGNVAGDDPSSIVGDIIETDDIEGDPTCPLFDEAPQLHQVYLNVSVAFGEDETPTAAGVIAKLKQFAEAANAEAASADCSHLKGELLIIDEVEIEEQLRRQLYSAYDQSMYILAYMRHIGSCPNNSCVSSSKVNNWISNGRSFRRLNNVFSSSGIGSDDGTSGEQSISAAAMETSIRDPAVVEANKAKLEEINARLSLVYSASLIGAMNAESKQAADEESAIEVALNLKSRNPNAKAKPGTIRGPPHTSDTHPGLSKQQLQEKKSKLAAFQAKIAAKKAKLALNEKKAEKDLAVAEGKSKAAIKKLGASENSRFKLEEAALQKLTGKIIADDKKMIGEKVSEDLAALNES